MALKVEKNPISEAPIENEILENISLLTKTEVKKIQECKDENLKNALILNRKKKYALLKILNRLKEYKKKLNSQKIECRKHLVHDVDDVLKASTFRLGMPYFKDKEMYSAPHNLDYFKLQENKELVQQSYCFPRPWSIVDKVKLAIAIYKLICYEKAEELKIQIATMEKDKEDPEELDHFYKQREYINNKELVYKIASKWSTAKILSEEELEEQKSDLRKQISYLESQVVKTNYKAEKAAKLKSMKIEFDEIEPGNYITSIVGNWTKNIDWLYVSCHEVTRHNDQECKFMWNAYLNPKINKKPWTDEQNLELNNIVQKYNMQNWEMIAQDLKLNKSPFQCCIHFYSKLWDNFRRTKWSRDEEIYLKTLIEMFKVGSYIPWGKVAKYFTERSKIQIYKHYVSCMQVENVKKGTFTLSEDILLCALLQHYKNLQKAAYFFPNRTVVQLRSRRANMGYNNRSWTFEDDITILKHVEKYGESNWNYVKLDRCGNVIRHRYNVLKKWIIEHPGENIVDVARRQKRKETQNKHLENKFVLEKAVNLLLEEIDEGLQPVEVFDLEHIDNLLAQIGFNVNQHPVVRTKKIIETSINSVIGDFFKYYFNFQGRPKSTKETDCADGAQKVQEVLTILGAKLNIPSTKELEKNSFLDEIDLKILKELSKEQSLPQEPQPGPSNQGTFPQNLVVALPNHPSQTKTSTPPQVKSYFPPEPTTLIGFRGLLLYTPVLKNFVLNQYRLVNQFLPCETRFNTHNTTLKQTIKVYKHQLKEMDPNKRDLVLDERHLFKMRIHSLFKWPALMSLPENEPQDSPFGIKVMEDVFEDSNVLEENKVIKKTGRPCKVSKKVQRMIEGKKRKALEKAVCNIEKRTKVEN